MIGLVCLGAELTNKGWTQIHRTSYPLQSCAIDHIKVRILRDRQVKVFKMNHE
jgi:hypothetical protein